MVSEKGVCVCVEEMKGVLHSLVTGTQVSPSISVRVLREFRRFLDVVEESSAFAHFEPKSDFLDVLLHETIAAQPGCISLWDGIH